MLKIFQEIAKRLASWGLASFMAAGVSSGFAAQATSEGAQIVLDASMLTNESGFGAPERMIDEQSFTGPFAAHVPKTMWDLSGGDASSYPASFYLDLGEVKHLSKLAFFDMNGHGEVVVEAGEPGAWEPVLSEMGVGVNKWKEHGLEVSTRYLRFTKAGRPGDYAEVLLWEQTPQERAALLEKARLIAEAEKEKALRPLVDAGAMFGELSLIDEVVLGDPQAEDDWFEGHTGATQVQTIFDKPVRVLPSGDEPGYFGVRLGRYKLLEPGHAYLLTVEYPEDEPRAFAIDNRGGDTQHGLRTGNTLGDVIFTYTPNNSESINLPLSGKMQTFRQLFYLSERSEDVRLARIGGDRPNTPEDGVVVLFSIPTKTNDPTSQGAAVYRVRLFDVPNPEQFTVKPKLPPGDLPRRHVFAREEMGDGSINELDPMRRAFDEPLDYFRYKIKLQQFYGFNTFAKDLLEFGQNQGWDSGGDEWYYNHKFPYLWAGILDEATKAGMDVLPYYEYAGSRGRLGLGHEKRAEPLSGIDIYTHIKWSEASRVDLTDPDTLTDVKKLLELTIVRHKDRATFVGAWFRSRISQIPMSFADATRERFSAQVMGGKPVTRADLRGDEKLLKQYYDWWFSQRLAFLTEIQSYLSDHGIDDPAILYTTVTGECGPQLWFPTWANTMALVTDQPDLWRDLLSNNEVYERLKVVPLQQAIVEGWQGKVATSPVKTWSDYEWQHAAPAADPQRYVDAEGIYMTYPFNRLYTVGKTSGMDRFQGRDGMAAIRFYPLNEDTKENMTGYVACDYDYTGPFVTLPEARLVAYGDPHFLGYLSGYTYVSGFPEYTLRFNLNFLALPALPSKTLDGVASHDDVVVREIKTDDHGSYFAVINVGYERVENVTLRLPGRGSVVNAVDEQIVGQGDAVTISLDPAELRSLHRPQN